MLKLELPVMVPLMFIFVTLSVPLQVMDPLDRSKPPRPARSVTPVTLRTLIRKTPER